MHLINFINLRYFVEFAYNGTKYHGWQIQPNANTVQQTLNSALSVILRKPTETMGAGRTDAGVHARQMYAHFDSDETLDCTKLVYKLNALLPEDIAVKNVHCVENEAHARFDAASRTYEYHIYLEKDVFTQKLGWHYAKKLDVKLMNEAAEILLGRHDFQCFSKSNTDVNNYYCTVSQAFWTESDHNLIFTIEADRFLRNMVRAIVGTLINVGLGKIDINQFKKIILTKDRSEAGLSVPAHGLFLTKVKYSYIQ